MSLPDFDISHNEGSNDKTPPLLHDSVKSSDFGDNLDARLNAHNSHRGSLSGSKLRHSFAVMNRASMANR